MSASAKPNATNIVRTYKALQILCPLQYHDDSDLSIKVTEQNDRQIVECSCACQPEEVINKWRNLGVWETIIEKLKALKGGTSSIGLGYEKCNSKKELNFGSFDRVNQVSCVDADAFIEKARELDLLVPELAMTVPSINMWIGDGGTLKTFLALRVLHAVGTETPFVSIPPRRRNVLYVFGEGHQGLPLRARALGIRGSTIKFYGERVDLLDTNQVERLIEVIRREVGNGSLVIFDTLSSCFSGDINAERDAKPMMENVKMLRNRVGACILLLHHVGHTNKDRGRGWSGIRPDLDSEYLCVKRKDKRVILRCNRVKDGEETPDMLFELRQVELDILGADGKPLRSAIAVPVDATTTENKMALSRGDTAALKALKTAIEKHGEKRPDTDDRVSVTTEQWRQFAYVGDGKASAKRQAFNRARIALKEAKIIENRGDFWMISIT